MTAHVQTVLALLPAASRHRLEELVRTLHTTLGDALSAILVYGSAVRGGPTPTSDIDLIIVLERDDLDTLRLLADPIALARASANIECRLLKRAEIAKAADVFPVFYDDVRTCHVMLHGKDPFSDLVIHDEHRRLRVEQELRDMRIRLRRFIIEHAHNETRLGDGVDHKLKAMRAPLASLMKLHGISAKDDLTTILDVLGKRYHLDTQDLSTTSRASGRPLAAVQALTALLDRAIDDVDSLTTSGSSP